MLEMSNSSLGGISRGYKTHFLLFCNGSPAGRFSFSIFENPLANLLRLGFDILHLFANAGTGGLVSANRLVQIILDLGNHLLQCFIFRQRHKKPPLTMLKQLLKAKNSTSAARRCQFGAAQRKTTFQITVHSQSLSLAHPTMECLKQLARNWAGLAIGDGASVDAGDGHDFGSGTGEKTFVGDV